MFKQLLQADAIDVVQIDAARVAGVNENIAILLLAAKFGVPVCPHAGGVGPVRAGPAPVDVRLRRRVAGRCEDRVIEYVDHLHEHFIDPVVIEDGPLRGAERPGFWAAMHPESLADVRVPDGRHGSDDPRHALPHGRGRCVTCDMEGDSMRRAGLGRW